MVDISVFQSHEDRVATVQIVGRGAAQTLKDLRQLREAHSPGVTRLASIHRYKAVMAGLVVAQCGAGVSHT